MALYLLNALLAHMNKHASHEINCKYRRGFEFAGLIDREKHVKFEYKTGTTVTIHNATRLDKMR